MTEELTEKIFSTEFELNSKLIAMIFLCYKYKFPLAFMLSFYEMYGDTSLFALKALSCCKKVKISDNSLIKIIEESRTLYNQVIKGISTIRKINLLKVNNPKDEEIPEMPELDLSVFSSEYKEFITNYLLVNIKDIYSPRVNLKLSTEDLYKELMPCEITI